MRLRCVMKLYDELKAEMETIQQQMAEAKKRERINALKEVKRLFKPILISIFTYPFLTNYQKSKAFLQ
jgi:hypothetical protein